MRLRAAYFIKCEEVIKDADGNVVELRCTYDPATRGGDAPDGRKVKATLHWVSAAHALEAEVRLYDHLLTVAEASEMDDDKDFIDYLNPNSLEVHRARPTSSRASPEPRPARATSSSASAISSSTPTPRRRSWSSTAPSRSRTSGRSSNKKGAVG